MKYPRYRIALLALGLSVLLTPFVVTGQAYDIVQLSAQQEFEWGVRSYHNGFYNEATLSFSRAVAQANQSVLARLWLARSYYATGLQDAAIEQYRILANNGATSPYIQGRIEAISTARNSDLLLREPQYTVAQEINGQNGRAHLFSRPAGIAVDDEINLYVTSFASHEVVRLSVNGELQRALGGRQYQFDRPYGVVVSEGRVLVSEFGNDRVVRFNREGLQEVRFNRAGINGRFAGPQYLTVDEAWNIYVSDWGNQRIVKVNTNGNFIFQFSRRDIPRRPRFMPTGVVYHNNLLYIANSADSTLIVSDPNGNYIRTISLTSGLRLEGLTNFDTQRLLVATTNGIFTFNSRTERLQQISGVTSELITSLAVDRNDTIYATDFNNNRILILSPIDEIYGGLNVHTLGVDSSRFPQITLDISVRNRFGKPMLGLQASNFSLREEGVIRRTAVLKEQAAERSLAIMLIVPMTSSMADVAPQLQLFVRELLDSLGPEDRVGVVFSGTEAVQRLEVGAPFVRIRNEISQLTRAAARIADGRALTQTQAEHERQFAAAVRVATTGLLSSTADRAIVYLRDGSDIEEPFERLDRQQLAQTLNVNSVAFIEVTLSSAGDAAAPARLDAPALSGDADAPARSTEELRGFYNLVAAHRIAYAESDAIGRVARALRASHDGRYRVSYLSVANNDFGRRYIPVSIEAALYQRSGRDEVGYYTAIN